MTIIGVVYLPGCRSLSHHICQRRGGGREHTYTERDGHHGNTQTHTHEKVKDARLQVSQTNGRTGDCSRAIAKKRFRNYFLCPWLPCLLPAPPVSLRPPFFRLLEITVSSLSFFVSYSGFRLQLRPPTCRSKDYTSPPLLFPPPYVPPHSPSVPLALLCPDWLASLMLRSHITSLCHLPPAPPSLSLCLAAAGNHILYRETGRDGCIK